MKNYLYFLVVGLIILLLVILLYRSTLNTNNLESRFSPPPSATVTFTSEASISAKGVELKDVQIIDTVSSSSSEPSKKR